MELGSVVLRALHVSGNIPGTPRWDELLDLADRTALNAVMRDLKDESGSVWVFVSIPVVGTVAKVAAGSFGGFAPELWVSPALPPHAATTSAVASAAPATVRRLMIDPPA